MYKKYLKKPTLNNKNKYITYKNKLTTYLRTTKHQYYYNIFQKCKNDCKKTWSNINSILGKKTKNSLPNSMYLGTTRYNSKQQIADSFNSYFANIGDSIANDIIHTKNSFQDYMKRTCDSTLFLKPTSAYEIIKYSKQLKPFKASGSDEISPRVIKECIHFIADPLCDIFNKSISSGVVPDKLKIAKIVPVFKKSDKDNIKKLQTYCTLTHFFKTV